MNREELQRYLIKCCYWYYVKCDPIIGDQEYDRLYYRLRAREAEEAVSPEDSPTQRLYGDRESQYPEWAKVRT